MILLVGGEKGGTGKTTISTNLAVMLSRTKKKKDLLFIDSDPQLSASSWCMVRDTREVIPRISSVQKTGMGLRHEVKALTQKFEDIIIDTGGRDSIEQRAGFLVADICLIPLRPSQFDLWTLTKINDMVREIRPLNENLRTIIFFNQVPTNPTLQKEVTEAKGFFRESGFSDIEIAESVVCERVCFRKAAPMGLGIHELNSDSKAEAELTALYEEVFA